jgi:hypothetical protein
MICTALTTLGLSVDQLMTGDMAFDEPHEYLNVRQVVAYHHGKEMAIDNMLASGNAYSHQPEHSDHLLRTIMDLGMTAERKDMRSMTVWERDLAQALADRKRGRVDG